jgi:hypothetical protein
VHSNPLKDVDGADTPQHLNAVGQWLSDNVFRNQGPNQDEMRGIWCTNCHTQLSQEIWRHEDCDDLINGNCKNNIRAQSLQGIAEQVADGDLNRVIAWLDPTGNDLHGTGLGDYTMLPWLLQGGYPDANVATIEVAAAGSPDDCNPLTGVYTDEFGVNVCVRLDADGDPSVNILSFCTTDDCVTQINDPANRTQPGKWRYPESGTVDGVSGFAGTGTFGAPVPFSAADDARDHWLAAGEPHCADCHSAPYVEQSGNITPYPPFNYPAKASLSRYTRGHQDISCQGCHESIHGLYPVGPAIDNTSYAQAAALNADGSHGPIKCGACHTVNGQGVPTWIGVYGGGAILPQIGSFDDAVTWAHTYTDEADVLNTTCQNCHGVDGDFGAIDTNSTPLAWTAVADHAPAFLEHAEFGLTSRQMMDKAEDLVNGAVTGPADGACTKCHDQNMDYTPALHSQGCDVGDGEWMLHLSEGRVAESVWEQVSAAQTGGTCGW